VSKVSFWTVAIQALMSAYACGIYLLTAIILGIHPSYHLIFQHMRYVELTPVQRM